MHCDALAGKPEKATRTWCLVERGERAVEQARVGDD